MAFESVRSASKLFAELGNNELISLEDIKGINGTLIMFICNHCPYVKAIIKDLVQDCNNLKNDGINSVAIMSNDTKNYPEDSFDNMVKFADNNNFGNINYLFDETQEIAKTYDAVCTPDFFGYMAIKHSWKHPLKPGDYAYLLPSGNLLWSGETENGPRPGGGKGGLLREYNWEGEILWEHNDDSQHHDFRRLKNGNTLYIGWEEMPKQAQQRMIGAEPGTEDENGITWSDYLKEVNDYGFGRLIYTDINRDGMKQSPNFEETSKVADVSDCPVIISGGVSSIEDIKKAKELNNHNIEGIIVGKAIYDGDIKLDQLVKELDA